jgi:biotin transport system substrate-specific component
MENIISREFVSNKRICQILAVGVFIVLTALSAFVRIPLFFTPVPLTLQTFFVLLSGALLGKKLGFFAQVSYLFLGLTGSQIFTGLGSGGLYLLGPTGGYIVGFIAASFLVGDLLSKEGQSNVAVFSKLLLADFVILFCGTLWLKTILSCSLNKAFLIGFAPFILGDLLKVALATVVYNKIHSRIKAVLR